MVLLQGPTGWRFLISEVLLSDNCVGVDQRNHAFAPVLLQGGLRSARHNRVQSPYRDKYLSDAKQNPAGRHSSSLEGRVKIQ